MGNSRHFFPGGNTCYGFHSFYHYLAKPSVLRKFILKGGPGVGKSTLMKQIGDHFLKQGCDVEFHWCSSDADSLDGIVIGQHQVCFLDGTAPHIVDPQYPGAVDEIINLGQHWQQDIISAQRDNIIRLTDRIAFCFERAYHRLQESQLALQEWSSYYGRIRNEKAVSRNIAALGNDFLQSTMPADTSDIRHLFPGAISPTGPVLKANGVLVKDTALFAIKGSPGSGVKDLFAHVLQMIQLNGIRAEIMHNPFDPAQIDLIFLPDYNRALAHISDLLFPYAEQLSGYRFRRQLDFDQLLPVDSINPYAKRIALARGRLENGVAEAVEWIELAKQVHDELEQIYVSAMNYTANDQLQEELIQKTADLL